MISWQTCQYWVGATEVRSGNRRDIIGRISEEAGSLLIDKIMIFDKMWFSLKVDGL